MSFSAAAERAEPASLSRETARLKGPPPGFSKGVNDALINASTLVHLKAAGLLGLGLTLSGLLLGREPAGEPWAVNAAGLLALASAVCAGAAVFPLKKVRRGGAVFWGDIAAHGSASDYGETLGGLDPAAIEREYAATNYNLSVVLQFKYSLIRWAVCLLVLGACLAGLIRIAA